MLAALPDGENVRAIIMSTPVPPIHVSQAIAESDQSAPLVVYLAQHPEALQDLASKHGPALYRALGALETRLGAAQSGPTPQARVTTPAIVPIQPVGTSPVSTTPAPEDLEFGPEYIRANNAKDRERRKLRY